MRVAIYARKSSESEDRQVQSLQDQLQAMFQLAAREGLIVAEVYQESRSAKEPGTRSEFARMIADIHGGKVEGIVTWSINRLSRNPVDGGQVAYLLQTGKLKVIHTIDRKYVPEDNALLLSIENGMATAYLQDLRKNVTRGMTSKASKGWIQSKAPVGYTNNILTREVDIDPARFHLVRSAWDLLLEGKSLTEIHASMQSRGLTIGSRYSPDSPISRTGVYGILTNPFYKGLIRFKGQELPGAHQPMVTEEEWETGQRILANTAKTRMRSSRDCLFARQIVCKTCGCAVVGERKIKYYPKTKRLSEYVYYHCSGAKGCKKNSLTETDVQRQLVKLADSITLDQDVSSWLIASFRQLQTLASNQSENIVRLGFEWSEKGANLRDSLKNGSNLKTITEAMTKLGKLVLDGPNLNLELHPVYKKLISFEPLRIASGSRLQTSFPLLSAEWWTILNDLLTLLEIASMQSTDTFTQNLPISVSRHAEIPRRTMTDEYERAIMAGFDRQRRARPVSPVRQGFESTVFGRDVAPIYQSKPRTRRTRCASRNAVAPR